ncbi:MAG: hypothetical protein QM589_15950 [Thermomicrobiales bacterium]
MVHALLRMTIAVVLALIGWLQAGPVTAAPAAPQVAFAHDAPAYDPPGSDTATERGPPALGRTVTTIDAVGSRAHGASTRSEASASPSTTTYAYPAGPVRVALATPTTRRHAVLADGDPSPSWRSVGATKALPALPKALSGGAADTYVYFGTRGGKNVYTGITNNLARRGAQHGERFDQLVRVTNQPVTRGQARSIEQALIARNPGFENKINSISPTHSYYDDAVSWGEAWLRQKGF